MSTKKNFLIIFFIICVGLLNSKNSFAQKPDSVVININKFDFAISNNGVIGELDGPISQIPQFEEGNIFSSVGFALSGIYNNKIWSNGIFNTNHVNNDYIPGKVGANPDDEGNKVYVVKSSDADFSSSWQEWKKAIELGANFYDGNNDGLYNPIDQNDNGKWDTNEDMPDLLGDLTAWCVYNDGLPESEREFIGMTPKGIEVKQTVFLSASPNTGNLENVFFVRYEIENTGIISEEFDSVYFAFTIDADLGYHRNDLASCDTNLQFGITYNSIENEDPAVMSGVFEERPPALILYPLQQPHTYIPGETYIDNNNNSDFDFGIDTPLDSSVINRGPLLRQKIIQGSKIMDWNAFTPYNRYATGLTDPYSEVELRNLMLGGRYSNGELFTASNFTKNLFASIVDSVTDPQTINPNFVASGDPIINNGWLYTKSFDFRMLISYGPFKFRKNDPLEVMCAIVVGRGDDRLSSVTEAKRIAGVVKEVYDNNFANLPVGIKENKKEIIPAQFKLKQNYPNPFNASTKINYSLAEDGIVKIKIVDILGREIATLVNKYQTKGAYSINFDGGNLPSGVYYYQIKIGEFVQTKKMLLLK